MTGKADELRECEERSQKKCRKAGRSVEDRRRRDERTLHEPAQVVVPAWDRVGGGLCLWKRRPRRPRAGVEARGSGLRALRCGYCETFGLARVESQVKWPLSRWPWRVSARAPVVAAALQPLRSDGASAFLRSPAARPRINRHPRRKDETFHESKQGPFIRVVVTAAECGATRDSELRRSLQHAPKDFQMQWFGALHGMISWIFVHQGRRPSSDPLAALSTL